MDQVVRRIHDDVAWDFMSEPADETYNVGDRVILKTGEKGQIKFKGYSDDLDPAGVWYGIRLLTKSAPPDLDDAPVDKADADRLYKKLKKLDLRALDEDNSFQVELDEFETAFTEDDLEPWIIRKLFRVIDDDDSGHINPMEFVKWRNTMDKKKFRKLMGVPESGKKSGGGADGGMVPFDLALTTDTGAPLFKTAPGYGRKVQIGAIDRLCPEADESLFDMMDEPYKEGDKVALINGQLAQVRTVTIDPKTGVTMYGLRIKDSMGADDLTKEKLGFDFIPVKNEEEDDVDADADDDVKEEKSAAHFDCPAKCGIICDGGGIIRHVDEDAPEAQGWDYMDERFKLGDKVLITVGSDDYGGFVDGDSSAAPSASIKGQIKYIGPLQDRPAHEVWVGIRIADSEKGDCDGTCKVDGEEYFVCPPQQGLFFKEAGDSHYRIVKKLRMARFDFMKEKSRELIDDSLIEVGDKVKVKTADGKEYIGQVRYKGAKDGTGLSPVEEAYGIRCTSKVDADSRSANSELAKTSKDDRGGGKFECPRGYSLFVCKEDIVSKLSEDADEADFDYMDELFEVGDRVVFLFDESMGQIKYISSDPDDADRYGIRLTEKHPKATAGKPHFECPPGFGLYVKDGYPMRKIDESAAISTRKSIAVNLDFDFTDEPFHVNDKVELRDGRFGQIKFKGVAPNIDPAGDVVYGIRLCLRDEEDGHDGTFKGTEEFECPMGYGIYVVEDGSMPIRRRLSTAESCTFDYSDEAYHVSDKIVLTDDRLGQVVWYGRDKDAFGDDSFYFGVRLADHGAGDCDGTSPKGKRLFECPADCGLFIQEDAMSPSPDDITKAHARSKRSVTEAMVGRFDTGAVIDRGKTTVDTSGYKGPIAIKSRIKAKVPWDFMDEPFAKYEYVRLANGDIGQIVWIGSDDDLARDYMDKLKKSDPKAFARREKEDKSKPLFAGVRLIPNGKGDCDGTVIVSADKHRHFISAPRCSVYVSLDDGIAVAGKVDGDGLADYRDEKVDGDGAIDVVVGPVDYFDGHGVGATCWIYGKGKSASNIRQCRVIALGGQSSTTGSGGEVTTPRSDEEDDDDEDENASNPRCVKVHYVSFHDRFDEWVDVTDVSRWIGWDELPDRLATNNYIMNDVYSVYHFGFGAWVVAEVESVLLDPVVVKFRYVGTPQAEKLLGDSDRISRVIKEGRDRYDEYKGSDEPTDEENGYTAAKIVYKLVPEDDEYKEDSTQLDLQNADAGADGGAGNNGGGSGCTIM